MFAVIASEVMAEHSGLSPYVFGGIALGALLVLLIITWFIKVGR